MLLTLSIKKRARARIVKPRLSNKNALTLTLNVYLHNT